MLTAAQYNANPAALKASDIVVGKNASKAAQITTNDGKQITLVLGTAAEPCEAPFGLSQWGDQPTDRVSLDLRTTPEIEQAVRKIDETVLAYVQAHARNTSGAVPRKKRLPSGSDLL